MRILGQPNLVMTFSYKNVAMALASSTLTALASAHFVTYGYNDVLQPPRTTKINDPFLKGHQW
jgi:hypothetical protein